MDPVSDATTAADGSRGCTENKQPSDDPAAAEVRTAAAVSADAASHVQSELPELTQPNQGELFAPPPSEPGSQPLENGKHEQFCQTVTGWGGSGEPVKGFEAYRNVYADVSETTARVNASRLLARPDVQDRCAWMRTQLAGSILMDRAAIRADLLNQRYGILRKTVNTKDKDVALAVMRDIEKSLGLDGPDVTRTVEETNVTAAAVAAVGKTIETVAAAFAAKQTVTTTTIKQ